MQLSTPLSTSLSPWNVWDNSSFTIESLGCKTAKEGVCYKNLDLTECIRKTQDLNSTAGYFIDQSPDNLPTICNPLNTNSSLYSSPIYMLRKKSNSKYPSYSFINSSVHPIPPLHTKSLYHRDHIKINIPSLKKQIDIDTPSNSVELSNQGSIFKIIQPSLTLHSFNKEKLILYGQAVEFLEIHTNYVLTVREQKLILSPFIESLEIKTKAPRFTIIPTSPDKMNTPINYTDSFFIYFLNNPISYSEKENTLVTSSHKGDLFSFSSLVKYFKCELGQCIEASIQDKDVMRSKDCFGTCNISPKVAATAEYQSTISFFIVGIIIFILIILVITLNK